VVEPGKLPHKPSRSAAFATEEIPGIVSRGSIGFSKKRSQDVYAKSPGKKGRIMTRPLPLGTLDDRDPLYEILAARVYPHVKGPDDPGLAHVFFPGVSI